MMNVGVLSMVALENVVKNVIPIEVTKKVLSLFRLNQNSNIICLVGLYQSAYRVQKPGGGTKTCSLLIKETKELLLFHLNQKLNNLCFEILNTFENQKLDRNLQAGLPFKILNKLWFY